MLLIGLLFYKRLPKPLEDTAQVLLQNMMLLFIPVIAGVMLEFEHLRREWLPFVLSCVLGAAITFTATALTFRFFLQRERAKSTKDEAATGNEQERARLLGEAQKMVAEDAVGAYLYQPQWITVANSKLQGVQQNMPVFVNDLASLRWQQ